MSFKVFGLNFLMVAAPICAPSIVPVASKSAALKYTYPYASFIVPPTIAIGTIIAREVPIVT
jgi:hypothetical protein